MVARGGELSITGVRCRNAYIPVRDPFVPGFHSRGGVKKPPDAAKGTRMPVMAPSRTIGEQTILERVVEGRGSEMDFSTGSQVPTDDVAAPAESGSKTVHAPRFDVTTDASRDALL